MVKDYYGDYIQLKIIEFHKWINTNIVYICNKMYIRINDYNFLTYITLCLVAFKFFNSGTCYCPFIPRKLLE